MRALFLAVSLTALHAYAEESIFLKEFGRSDRFEIVTGQTVTSDVNDRSKARLVYTPIRVSPRRTCILLTQNKPQEQITIPAGTRLQLVQIPFRSDSKIFADANGSDLKLVIPATGQEVAVMTCGSHSIFTTDSMFSRTLNATMAALAATVVKPEVSNVNVK